MNGKPNTLLGVAALVMRLSRKYVALYSHAKSPHRFTQSQLLSCLVVKAYCKTTYCGIIELLDVSEALRRQMGLSR